MADIKYVKKSVVSSTFLKPVTISSEHAPVSRPNGLESSSSFDDSMKNGMVAVAKKLTSINDKITSLIAEQSMGQTSPPPPIEAIQEASNIGRIIYPPDPRFMHSYRCWHEHQENMWTSHENHPETDAHKFNQADPRLCEIMLRFTGCLMWGDTTVLEFLNEDVLRTITAPEVLYMLDDQKARENIHQEIYSKMLDVADPITSAYYRSQTFRDRYMMRFTHLAERYTNCDDLRIVLYFIMLCENIMFAPAFQAICYLAYKGYAPKLGDLNRQVMRDEFVHYKHARGLLAALNQKINHQEALEIFEEFKLLTQELIDDIVGNYQTDDGLFSKEILFQHLDYICHWFLLENSLYRDEAERDRGAMFRKTSPAHLYMSLPQTESKINLMEANATIYMIENGNNMNTDLNMDFTLIA